MIGVVREVAEQVVQALSLFRLADALSRLRDETFDASPTLVQQDGAALVQPLRGLVGSLSVHATRRLGNVLQSMKNVQNFLGTPFQHFAFYRTVSE